MRLNSWLGELTYNDFSQLIIKVIALLENGQLKDMKNPKKIEIELNRLDKRRKFWDAYKQSFSRMRAFFPQETIIHLNSEAQDLLNVCEVEILGNGEQVEVCIFELRQFIIAEVFRGDITEIFIFEGSDRARMILFQERIGLDLLRADHRLHRLKIFDHNFCWQGEVQRWLFMNQVPTDSGVKLIQGIPINMRFVNGMVPLPNKSDLQKRLKSLNHWEIKRKELVEQARSRINH